jgi:hypothetical protein
MAVPSGTLACYSNASAYIPGSLHVAERLRNAVRDHGAANKQTEKSHSVCFDPTIISASAISFPSVLSEIVTTASACWQSFQVAPRRGRGEQLFSGESESTALLERFAHWEGKPEARMTLRAWKRKRVQSMDTNN